MNIQPKDATAVTKAANAKLLQRLPFADRRDFEEANRGFIAPLPNDGVIKADNGRVVWDLSLFNFIKQDQLLQTASTPACGGSRSW